MDKNKEQRPPFRRQWFTADTHINHARIIELCKRPFKSVEEMNDILISNINSVVDSNDILYHLGDFALGGYKYIPEWRAKIKCHTVVLILGNHDPQDKRGRPHKVLLDSFQGVYDMLKVGVQYKGEKKSIILNHYAMRVWRNSHHGSWMIFGHSHGSLWDDPHSLSFDVGVDCHNFMPLSVDQIGDIMATKTFVPIDHHDEQTT